MFGKCQKANTMVWEYQKIVQAFRNLRKVEKKSKVLLLGAGEENRNSWRLKKWLVFAERLHCVGHLVLVLGDGFSGMAACPKSSAQPHGLEMGWERQDGFNEPCKVNLQMVKTSTIHTQGTMD